VHFKSDGGRHALYSQAEANHKKFKAELIFPDGGKPMGDPCEVYAYNVQINIG
jgi:hypothetical protein